MRKNNHNISLFILAHNEEENISDAVHFAHKFLTSSANNYEIIVIDDGSSDNTFNIAKSLRHSVPNLKVVRHARNRGYGAAQLTGFRKSRYEIITYLPADNQLRDDALKIMFDFFLKTNTDIVIGCRKDRNETTYRRLLADIYNFGLRKLFGFNVQDIDSIKLIKKEIFDSISLNLFSAAVDAELIIKAHKKGFDISEIAVPSYPRRYGASSGAKPTVIIKQIKDLISLWFKRDT